MSRRTCIKVSTTLVFGLGLGWIIATFQYGNRNHPNPGVMYQSINLVNSMVDTGANILQRVKNSSRSKAIEKSQIVDTVKNSSALKTLMRFNTVERVANSSILKSFLTSNNVSRNINSSMLKATEHSGVETNIKASEELVAKLKNSASMILNKGSNIMQNIKNPSSYNVLDKVKNSSSTALKRGSNFFQTHLSTMTLNTSFHVYSNFIYTRDAVRWSFSSISCKNTSLFRFATLRTETGNTPIFVYDPKDDKWVSNSIITQGSWESPHISLILSLLKQEDRLQFIDIGTNLGVFALSVAKFGRKVIAIDALLMNIERLCASVEAGNFTNSIKLVHNALSDVRETVSLGMDEANVGGTFVAKDKNPNKVRGSRVSGNYGSVQTVLLNDILQLPGFDFEKVIIKIDVEGYENRVFKGAELFFQKVHVTAVLMEWMWLKSGPAGQEIIEFFTRHNFEPTYPTLSRSVLDIKSRASWPNDVLWRHK